MKVAPKRTAPHGEVQTAHDNVQVWRLSTKLNRASQTGQPGASNLRPPGRRKSPCAPLRGPSRHSLWQPGGPHPSRSPACVETVAIRGVEEHLLQHATVRRPIIRSRGIWEARRRFPLSTELRFRGIRKSPWHVGAAAANVPRASVPKTLVRRGIRPGWPSLIRQTFSPVGRPIST